MSMQDVLDALLDLETKCICGETNIDALGFEYVSDLIAWLEGKPIGHYGLIGCCTFAEEEE